MKTCWCCFWKGIKIVGKELFKDTLLKRNAVARCHSVFAISVCVLFCCYFSLKVLILVFMISFCLDKVFVLVGGVLIVTLLKGKRCCSVKQSKNSSITLTCMWSLQWSLPASFVFVIRCDRTAAVTGLSLLTGIYFAILKVLVSV